MEICPTCGGEGEIEVPCRHCTDPEEMESRDKSESDPTFP
jgi:DnaJ-class molecular chaperone